MKTDMVKTHEVVEQFIRGLTVNGADPQSIFHGVCNAFCHGTILAEADYDLGKKDKHLKKFFEGIDVSIDALRAMQK